MPQSCFEQAVLVEFKLSGSPKNWNTHNNVYSTYDAKDN